MKQSKQEIHPEQIYTVNLLCTCQRERYSLLKEYLKKQMQSEQEREPSVSTQEEL